MIKIFCADGRVDKVEADLQKWIMGASQYAQCINKCLLLYQTLNFISKIKKKTSSHTTPTQTV